MEYLDAGNYVRFIAALLFVLALIAFATWLARRFGVGGQTAAIRRSDRRLKVVEAVTVDAKHRAVLISRDGVEHLVLLGATGAVAIETGIDAPAAAASARNAPASAHDEDKP